MTKDMPVRLTMGQRAIIRSLLRATLVTQRRQLEIAQLRVNDMAEHNIKLEIASLENVLDAIGREVEVEQLSAEQRYVPPRASTENKPFTTDGVIFNSRIVDAEWEES